MGHSRGLDPGPTMKPTPKLRRAVEDYFRELARLRATGGATRELSTYPPLVNLLNAVGGALKPKVFCVQELADQGAGHPDVGLYTSGQIQQGQPLPGQIPERGVVEVKPPEDDLDGVAAGDQVLRYQSRYRLVLVTNLREFRLVGSGPGGEAKTLEKCELARNASQFHRRLGKPRAFARDAGPRLVEYLVRALTHRAAIAEPKDLAWLLASYARDGLSRVEAADEGAALEPLRKALEEALDIRFEGARGKRLFHSTLVQTLFYGIFSAWVLWVRSNRETSGFDWRTAAWHLRAPVLRALFQQFSGPGNLQSLGLVEVLDQTVGALERVDRKAFFARFREGEAVPYFYEPFLAAFDPGLRKQLGVWYTPNEIVRYMVARVDRALKDDLGIPDGLAGDQVHVLDPCCGTGAYLAEVLRRIARNLESRGLGALVGAQVKDAATKRVSGFEIMPAPLVVAHLQVGLTMEELGAPLSDGDDERVRVFLTNALTGWEKKGTKSSLFPELAEERERAERVKQKTPILVILGNPPYNGFAGMAEQDEERKLTTAYRKTKQAPPPRGQGLNDLYVRFFRVAERRIVEGTGRGIVCFISNYSWLDGLSFPGMRERYLEAFDLVRVDNLHGDRIISEYAPDGQTSETVFALPGQSPGIKIGTSITLLSRSRGSTSNRPATVLYRDFHEARADARRRALIHSLSEPRMDSEYTVLEPKLELGLPFKPMAVSEDWFDWPSLPELFPVSFPGVKTSRDGFLVDVDLDRLKTRVEDYFDKSLSHEEIARRYPSVMKGSARYRGRATRDALLRRGGPTEAGWARFAYRPFDTRWLYWEAETDLLDRKRANYRPHVFPGNLWLSAGQHLRKGAAEPQADFTTSIGSLHVMERGANWFPGWLYNSAMATGSIRRRPNLSSTAKRYLSRIGCDTSDLFHHVLATLHARAYRTSNRGGLRMGWPRIPLPGWPDGRTEGATEQLRASAARGRELARLLDPDTPVPGVTEGALRPEMASIAVPTTVDGSNMTGADFAVTAGWGHFGAGDAVMPGTGRAVRSAPPPPTRHKLAHPTGLGTYGSTTVLTGGTSPTRSGTTASVATRC